MAAKPTVFIVDDDPAVREALRTLVESVGLTAESYASFPEFLDIYARDRPGCLVLDVRMPGMSGIEGLETLKAQGMTLPVIVITGYGDVPTVVRAMKGGAAEFLEKPFNDQELLDCIQLCIAQNSINRLQRAERKMILSRMSLLTSRERQVMDLVVAGKSSKAIAHELGIARRTVEVHRTRLMHKMQAKSIQSLLQMVASA